MGSQRPIFDPQRMTAQPDEKLAPRRLTVSQLNALVKRVLGGNMPANIQLVGQISNCSRPGSGHLYLTLKDDRAEVRAVMWKSAATGVKFKIEDGLEVIATGNVDVYEPRGQYQFYIRKLEPKGVGDLELAFRQLRARLEAEGLFDESHKKPIPRFPRRIGVVTSATGAAVHDILTTLGRRYPCVEILLYPVRVQGEEAAREIAEAIAVLNQRAGDVGGIDVLIVGRGGGSLEELWAFNEEIVARAIFASGIPVIAAVGHEVDVTIADLVADQRAATPTAAAELAAPVLAEVLESVARCEQRLRRNAVHAAEIARSRLAAIERAELFRDPLAVVRRGEQQIDEAAGRLHHAVDRAVHEAHRRLNELHVRLVAVRPSVLVRDRQAGLAELDHRLQAAVQRQWRQAERRCEHLARKLAAASPGRRVAVESEKLRQYRLRLDREMQHRLSALRSTVAAMADRLEAMSYRRTLARGFTVTWDADRQRIIRRPADAAKGQIIVTETDGGDLRSRVE